MRNKKQKEFAQSFNDCEFYWIDCPTVNGLKYQNEGHNIDKNCWYLCQVLDKFCGTIYYHTLFSDNNGNLNIDEEYNLLLCWTKLENPTSNEYFNTVYHIWLHLKEEFITKSNKETQRLKELKILELKQELKDLENDNK